MGTENNTKGDSTGCYWGGEKKLEGKREKKGEGRKKKRGIRGKQYIGYNVLYVKLHICI